MRTPVSVRFARGYGLLTVLVLCLAFAGCKDDDPGFKTVTLSGTVEAIDLDKSRVRITFHSEKYDREITAEAIVTPETEILINGIAAELADVEVGERAEGETIVTHEEGGDRVITVTRVRIERGELIAPIKPAPPGQPATGS
ncbi:MAG: hypothetical protein GY842_07630 [bacterium]|nr:hypothetical protein [bacterium]